ncbi:putative gustatory receptor 28b [Microplitis demolitor]|uniref:putative gustatory receptor 28b n=1 Tax=Microplitis demolitor TaxID=69319 RepID=UPI00235B6DFE|nr:putative gustatory receptor 28b [Microplitis demolitor]
MVMTSFITEIRKQIKKTARIINLLVDRFSADEKIRKKLEKFSNDLWHLTIDFTACDIIPLDRTLLAIITGTIATYLVIAVQFRVSSPSD